MKGTNIHINDSDIPAGTENAEYPSKSQLKRDSKALQELGKKLSRLNPDQLAQIPLNAPLEDAIALSHKLANKRGALKRHHQYIGKLLRNTDATAIIESVQAIEDAQANSVQVFKNIERWRDRILQEGDSAIQEFCSQHEFGDRQKLRQLYRNHGQATDDQKIRFARLLFQELRAAS